MKKSKLKTLICAGLASVTALSMTACDNNKDTNKDSNSTTVVWTADSAYAQAVSEGYKGTFEDFLKTLSGIKQAEINSSGNLILTLGDDSTINVGKVKGDNGYTPEIGANGNWWIAGVDTTIKAQGVGIASVGKTSTDGLVDTYTITYTDGKTSTFTVTNGSNGATGAAGVSITGATVNANGELVLTLSEGNPINVGKVVGATGAAGADGVSVQEIKVEEGKLFIKLSNSETFTDLGSIKGDPGVGIAKVETTSDRWGLIVTTRYTYTDSTTEKPHIEEITVNNGTSFGRVYDATSSEELVYLLSNGVTNIAITSTSENFYLTSAVTCNIKTTPIYDTSTNQYLHYIIDLNGHTLNFTKDLTFDEVNVLIKNGLVEEGDFGIIAKNNANVSITHTFEKNVETLSDSSVSQANGIINEINAKVYNSSSLAGSTHYTLEELNAVIGENALSNYYVEVETTSIYYKRLTIGGTTYKKGQIVNLSIGNNNFIDAEAYYVEDGKLYVCAPIVATASAEKAPYTITGLAYDKNAFEITDKGNNVYDVVVKNGTSILYIKIGGVEQSDIFLRKATDNGHITFGFTGTDKVPNENTYSYGIYPAGWVTDISQYEGFTKEFIADLYIVGKGTVHFTLNVSIPNTSE